MLKGVRLQKFVYAFAAAAVLLLGCGGEDRPRVDVIEDGTPGGSGSVSGSASASGAGPSSPGSAGGYTPVSNVDIYFEMAADLRDIRAVMQPATEGRAVDWAAAAEIYEQGKNQKRPDGTLRSLASIPNEAVYAVFPDGTRVYGSSDFINELVRDGLNGSGRGAGLSDNARRQMVDKGIQMLLYGKALQEMEAAKTRIAEGNTADATGAPHAVDEAWGAIAGPEENGNRPHGLLATATSREGNFKLEGKLRQPLEDAFVRALDASRKGDAAGFDRAYSDVKGYLNSVFYLASLRYVSSLQADEKAEDRETHFAEGRTFFQTIRAQVASGSSAAAAAVEAAYTRSPQEPFPAAETTRVYAALNEAAVIQALGIPAALVVRNPPQ